MTSADELLHAADAAGLRARQWGSRVRMRCPTCGTDDAELVADLDRDRWICHRCARQGFEPSSGWLSQLLALIGRPGTADVRTRRADVDRVVELVDVAQSWPLLVESQTETDDELVAQWAHSRGWPGNLADMLPRVLRADVAVLHGRPGYGEAVAALGLHRAIRRPDDSGRWQSRDYPVAFALRDVDGRARDVERRTLGPVAAPFKKGYRLTRGRRVAEADELVVCGDLTRIHDGARVHVAEGVPTVLALRLCFPDDVVVGVSSGTLPRLGRAIVQRIERLDLQLDVALWPDVDPVGHERMAVVADLLSPLVGVRWAVASHGSDAADVLSEVGLDGVLDCLERAERLSRVRPRLTDVQFSAELDELSADVLRRADADPGALIVNATVAGAGKTTSGVLAAARHGVETGTTSAYLVRTVGNADDPDDVSLLSEAAAVARANGVEPIEVRGALRSCRVAQWAPMLADVYRERGRRGVCGPTSAPNAPHMVCEWQSECAGSPQNRPAISGPLVIAAHQWAHTPDAAGAARVVLDELPNLTPSEDADSWAVATLTTSERERLTRKGLEWSTSPAAAPLVTAADMLLGRIGAVADEHRRAVLAGADPWPRVLYADSLARLLSDCRRELQAVADTLVVVGSADPMAPPVASPAAARSARPSGWPSSVAYRAIRALCAAVCDPTSVGARRVTVRIEPGGQWRISVRSPLDLPNGPVILSDATAHFRAPMLAAVTGRRVEVHAVDCAPRRAAAALHIRTGHFRTPEICTPDRWGRGFWYRDGIAAAVRRVIVSSIAEAARAGIRATDGAPRRIAVLTHRRLALGLLAAVETRETDSSAHRAESTALASIAPDLLALGWHLECGYYGRDDRGQNAMARADVMLTIGDPRDDWATVQADAHFADVDPTEDSRGRVRSALTQSHARSRTARYGGVVHVHAGDCDPADLPDVGRPWALSALRAGPAPRLSRAYALDLLISWADRDGYLAAPLAVAALTAAGVKERTAYRLAAAEAESRGWARHELVTRTGRAVVWANTEDAAKAAPLLGPEDAGGGSAKSPYTITPESERSETRGVCPDVCSLDPVQGAAAVSAVLADLVLDPVPMAASIVLAAPDAAAEVRRRRAALAELPRGMADDESVSDEAERQRLRAAADRDRRLRVAT